MLIGEKAIRPADPTKANQSFLGWYLDGEEPSDTVLPFNFDSTSITTTTSLHAEYKTADYDGDWGRIFLISKNSYAIADTEEAMKSLGYYTLENGGSVSGFHLLNADGSLGEAVTVQAADVKEIEVGLKMTRLAGNTAPATDPIYTNLEKFVCKSPLTTSWGSQIINTATRAQGVDGYILFPPTLKSVGAFLTNGSNFIGTIDFQVSPDSVSIYDATMFITAFQSQLQYTQGIKATGPYADQWMKKFPNGQMTNTMRWRKLIKV